MTERSNIEREKTKTTTEERDWTNDGEIGDGWVRERKETER